MATLVKPVAKELPLPAFFSAKHAEQWSYSPNVQDLATAAASWAQQHGIKPPAATDTVIDLMVIDGQKDFCFPEGTLYVGGRSGRGAIEDNVRLASFLYRNLHRIRFIRPTMDTHFLFQIFSPWFWQAGDGTPLSAHSMIRVSDDGRSLTNILPDGTVLHEHVRPNPTMAQWLCNGNYVWLTQYVHHYCAELAREGKYTLYLWPPHCLLGSDGHALAGVLQEARLFHDLVRGTQSWAEVKGGNFLTENYSVFKPEVLATHDGQTLGQRNTDLMHMLLTADYVLFAGQAASHCVKSSIDDFLDEIAVQNPALARKVYIMEDCMSAVAVPDGKGGFVADFTPQADAALQRFAKAGMHVVRSTDPITSWPDITLM